MPARVSDAIVLQTYPFKEADLIVSFLTRDLGKLRGVARRARRPKGGFGAGLERLSQVKMAYYQRENRELVQLDTCELVHSQFALLSDYAAGIALDYFAEVSEQLLPADEPSEKFFRLLSAVLEHMRSGVPGAVWRGVTYFAFWAVRLYGILPEMHACLGCESWLDDPESPERVYFSRGRHGLFCNTCRQSFDLRNCWELSMETRGLASVIQRHPVAEIAPGIWMQDKARELRRFLNQQIEQHIERRLITVPLLEAA